MKTRIRRGQDKLAGLWVVHTTQSHYGMFFERVKLVPEKGRGKIGKRLRAAQEENEQSMLRSMAAWREASGFVPKRLSVGRRV